MNKTFTNFCWSKKQSKSPYKLDNIPDGIASHDLNRDWEQKHEQRFNDSHRSSNNFATTHNLRYARKSCDCKMDGIRQLYRSTKALANLNVNQGSIIELMNE